MDRLILVTGASGFIGSHLCAALLERGERVRALYRRRQPPAELRELAERFGKRSAAAGPSLELFNADLGDRARVLEAVSGVDSVIHVAALAADWGELELFVKANYDATVLLLEAAREAGARRFLYFSSAQVHGYGDHVDTTERGPYFPLVYPYQITKRMAEEYVLAQDSPSFRATAVRPCNVYGPGDYKSMYAMFDNILGGVFGYLGDGSRLTCPVYVDDLCAGVLLALECEESGGRAILLGDGDKVSWRDFSMAMFSALGSRRRPVAMPVPIAYAAAGAMAAAKRLVRSEKAPPLTKYVVDQGAHNFHFSIATARSLLGFEPRVFFEEGIGRTAKAYLSELAARPGAKRLSTGR
jgi:Nucleoside-diphosphate-sugar epimerases